MRKRFILLILIFVTLMILYSTSYNCFLDRLNANIKTNTVFKPFYAGIHGLPSTQEYIPELKHIEDEWEVVRDEMNKVMNDNIEIPTMHEMYNNMFLYKGSGKNTNSTLVSYLQRKVAEGIYGKDVNTFDKIGSDKWRTFNLILFNRDVPVNTNLCPNTTRLLKKIPGMQSALFSFMKPGAYVPPHNDPAKGVIRYHLALKVPKDSHKCFINVDGKNYHWKEGKGVIFDDVYDHWVRNDSDETRVILFVDILRPLEGKAKIYQELANFANYVNPGVTRLIEESKHVPL